VISVHSSPLDQPGTGDSGGMNVYVRTVARLLAQRGVAADIFTRAAGRGAEVTSLGPWTRIIEIPAGPREPVPKADLPRYLPPFTKAMLERTEAPYSLIQSHYWLSGLVGREAKARWGVPLVALFHTLGRVKNDSLADGDVPESDGRIRGEQDVVQAADRIVMPSASEAAHLSQLYHADPARIRLAPPGVDARRFHPADGRSARKALGLEGRRVVLFAGRLQPLKGPDVAVRAVAEAVVRDPRLTRDLTLAVVGGPSGAEVAFADQLERLASDLGVRERVRIFPPRPHEALPHIYAAAEAILMPSRSESFGLVALEAQACGVPVVASAVGGLRSLVDHGRSGYLVPGHDPGDFAERLLAILGDPDLAERLSAGGIRQAARFSWEASVRSLLAVYTELVPALAATDEIPA
jgi:D-inositol-3-phosphate glycosyltransferase